ncbi:phosphoenolpyruvate/phosphate translocator 2 [Cucumis melo var. makuwa]|nr:phosphoenolpyruvate/phosphate translocator 2 [Cucumis melo var. makuwa]
MWNNAVMALAMSFSPNSIATATAAIPSPNRSPNFPHFSHILHFRSHESISWRSSSSSSSSSISVSSFGSTPRLQKFVVMAASSVPESAGEGVESVDLVQNLRLGAMFGIWYLLNIYYNIFNKQ